MANTDITQTGAQSWRDLQKQNNLQQSTGMEVLDMPVLTGKELMYSPESILDKEVKSPIFTTEKDYWGKSRFDKSVAYGSEFENLQDIRAENQSGFSKIVNGVTKGIITAGTTFLDGTIGLVIGINQGIENLNDDNSNTGFLEGLYNNKFSKSIRDIQQASEEVFPNYYTQYEQENPLAASSIFSANFIGDKFLKNIGYTVGAFYSGGLYSGIAKGLVKGIGKGVISLKGLRGTTGVMNSMRNVTKASEAVSQIVGAGMSALNEGRIEALNTTTDWYNLQKAQLDDDLRQKVIEVQDYQESDPTGYANYLQMLQTNYDEKLKQLELNSSRIGNLDLMMNLAILLPSNLFQFGKIYARGFDSYISGIKWNQAKRMFEPDKAERTFKQRFIRGTADALSEGKEEVLQQIASDYSGTLYTPSNKDFYNLDFSAAEVDPITGYKTLEASKALMQTLSSTLSNDSTWEQFIIGGLTGALGMPVFGKANTKQAYLGQNKIIGLEGGLVGELVAGNRGVHDNDEVIYKLNQRVQDSDFQAYYKGLLRHNKFEDTMKAAALADNKKVFKDSEYAQMVSDIQMFAETGQLREYKQLLKEAVNTSDENIQSIIEITTATHEDGNGKQATIGPFIDRNGNPKSVESIRKSIENTTKEMLDTVDKWVEASDILDSNFGDILNREEKNELIWKKLRSSKAKERAIEIAESAKEPLRKILPKYESIIEDTQKHAEYYGEEILLDEKNQAILNNIKQISSALNSETTGLVKYLSESSNSDLFNRVTDYLIAHADTQEEVERLTNIKKDVADIPSLLNDSIEFSKQYKFYTTHLEELAAKQLKEKEEAIKKEKERKATDLAKKLDTASTVQETNKVLSDSETTSQEKDAAIAQSTNPVTKETSIIRDRIAEIKRYIGYLPNISNEEINNIFDLLDKWTNQAQSLSELSVDSDFFRDINNFQETPNEPIAIRKVKFENARKILAQAFKGTTQEVGNAGTIVNAPIETLTPPTDYTSGPIVAVINESGKISDGSTTMPPVNPTTVIPKKEIVEDGNITTVIDDEENTHIIENQADEEVALEEDNSKAAHKILDNTQNPIERQSAEAKEIYNRPAVGKYTLESMRIGPNGEAPKWSTSGHPEWEKVHNYLEGKGAYEYIDSGKLAKYKGEVYYGVDPTFDNKLVLMFVKNPDGTYQVIGSNFMSKSKTDQFIGLTQLNEDVLNEYSSREKSDELFISSRTATVQSVREGRIKYSDETRSVNEALLSTDELQISDIDILVATTSGLTGNIEDIRALSNLYKKIGMAYLAVPNCKGTKSLIPIIPATFSADMLEADNYLAKKMKNAIMNLANALGTKDRGNLGNRIKDVLKYLNARDLDISLNADGDIVRLNARVRDDKGKVKQKKGKDGNLYDATTPIAMISLTAEDTSVANIYNQIVAALEATNTKIRINKNLLEDRQYKDSIIKDGYATTHAVNLKPEASWFTLKNNPVSSNKEKPKVTPITIQEASNLWDNRHNYTADKEAKPSVFQQMLEKIMHLGPSYSLTEGERLTDSEELINLATSNPELSISKDILNKKITMPAQQTPQSVGINPADLFSGLMGTGMKFSTVSSIDRVPSKTTVRDIQRKAMRQLRRILPQLSNTESLRVVNYLLTDEGKLANGLIDLQRGIITLSKTGAEGTVYHEAYHYVSNLLLSPQEKIEIFNEAKEIYGDLSEDILEEKLADGFRDYMLTRDSSSIKDRIKNWFRKLYNIVTNWSKTPKNIAGLYQAIAEGKYKNVDKVAEMSANVYYSINSPYLFNPYDIDDRAEYAKELKFYYNFGKFKSISSRNIEAELQRLKAEHPHMEFRVSKNGRITESLGKDIVGTTQIYPIKPKLMPIAKAEAWLKDLEEFTEDSIKKEITIQERNAIQEEFEELGYPSELLDTMTYEELQQLKECHGF